MTPVFKFQHISTGPERPRFEGLIALAFYYLGHLMCGYRSFSEKSVMGVIICFDDAMTRHFNIHSKLSSAVAGGAMIHSRHSAFRFFVMREFGRLASLPR